MSHLHPFGEELKEIPQEQSLFESKLNKELDHCLFFKKEEVDELMGHCVKFYPNGVLLVMQDRYKDFSKEKNPNIKYESKSFVFYNNESVKKDEAKEPIFKIHNRNWNHEIRELQPPIRDIDLTVYEHYLFVREVGAETKEYIVDILTGEKKYFVQTEDQLTYDI